MFNQIDPYYISTDNIKSFTHKTYQMFKSHGVKLSHCECLELVSKYLLNTSYEKARCTKLRKPVKIKLIRKCALFNAPDCFKTQIQDTTKAASKMFYSLENMVEKQIPIAKQFLAYYSLIHFSSSSKKSDSQSFYGKGIHAYVRFNYEKNGRLVIDIGELDYKYCSLLYDAHISSPKSEPDTKADIPLEIIDFIIAVCSVHSNVKVTFNRVKNQETQYLLNDIGATVDDKRQSFDGDILSYSYYRY